MHVAQRALFPGTEALSTSEWYAITSGHRVRDAQCWRVAVVDDVERTLKAALQYTKPVVAVEACASHEAAHSLQEVYGALRATAVHDIGMGAETQDEVMVEAETMGDQ